MNMSLWLSKLRASALHLLLSALVLATAIGLMLYFWYPSPYYRVEGLGKVLQVLIGVDLVLGPLLTFIVFRRGKPTLKFDLAVIAMVQLGALGYGVYTAYVNRPVFAVFAVDRFTTVARPEVDLAALTIDEIRPRPWRGPQLVSAQLPDDRAERQKILFSSVGGGRDIEQLPEYFIPYPHDLDALRRHSVDVAGLAANDPAVETELADFTARHGDLGRYLFIPLLGKQQAALLALAAESGAPVGYLAVDPWTIAARQAAR